MVVYVVSHPGHCSLKGLEKKTLKKLTYVNSVGYLCCGKG